jgi:hypothetical protein
VDASLDGRAADDLVRATESLLGLDYAIRADRT